MENVFETPFDRALMVLQHWLQVSDHRGDAQPHILLEERSQPVTIQQISTNL
jgi:hypothetical protein